MQRAEINKNAPAVAAAEAIVAAPIDTVWELLMDFERWPDWNPGVSKMELLGGTQVGSRFVWVAGGSKIVSRLAELEPPHRVVWSGTTLGIRAMHVWEFETLGGHTRVRTRESFDGLLVRLLPGPMRKMLHKTLQRAVATLKREAESRHAALSVA